MNRIAAGLQGIRVKSPVNAGQQIFTIWVDEYIPTNRNEVQSVNFSLLNGKLDKPVYVDILTGGVFEIPESQIVRKGNLITFRGLPVYDAPILVADASILTIKKL